MSLSNQAQSQASRQPAILDSLMWTNTLIKIDSSLCQLTTNSTSNEHPHSCRVWKRPESLRESLTTLIRPGGCQYRLVWNVSHSIDDDRPGWRPIPPAKRSLQIDTYPVALYESFYYSAFSNNVYLIRGTLLYRPDFLISTIFWDFLLCDDEWFRPTFNTVCSLYSSCVQAKQAPSAAR